MTKAQFSEAVKIATNPNTDLDNVNYDVLYGCGLPDFKPSLTRKSVWKNTVCAWTFFYALIPDSTPPVSTPRCFPIR